MVVFSVGFPGVAGWPHWVSRIESCWKVWYVNQHLDIKIKESTSRAIEHSWLKNLLFTENLGIFPHCFLKLVGRLLEVEKFIVSYDNDPSIQDSVHFSATLEVLTARFFFHRMCLVLSASWEPMRPPQFDQV